MTPNWQTYKVEQRNHGLRRYRARSTYVAINGLSTEQHYAFTQRGAEMWIARLRERQIGAWRTA